MDFRTGEMAFPVFHPNPELLEAITAGSGMKTPDKVRQVMGELVFPPPPADRPYLYGCMVLSFDGKMGFHDHPEGTLISRNNAFDPVGARTDFWIMNVCRAYSDAVIFGTGTLRARMDKVWYAEISDPDLAEARRGLGKHQEEPLSIIASVDGRDIPFNHPIFSRAVKPLILTSCSGGAYLQQAAAQPVQILTEPRDLWAGRGQIQILAAGEETPDTAALLKLLRTSGVGYISVEAPGYIWVLLRAGLLDEYLLNYSGVLAGGPNTPGDWGGFSAFDHPHAALLSVGYGKGFLFTRQKLLYGV